MTQIKRPSTALKKARDLLQQEGWTQGTFICTRGRRCATGALADVTGDLKRYQGIGANAAPDIEDDPSDLFKYSLFYLALGLDQDDEDFRFIKRDDWSYNLDVVISENDRRAEFDPNTPLYSRPLTAQTVRKRVFEGFDKAIKIARQDERQKSRSKKK